MTLTAVVQGEPKIEGDQAVFTIKVVERGTGKAVKDTHTVAMPSSHLSDPVKVATDLEDALRKIRHAAHAPHYKGLVVHA